MSYSKILKHLPDTIKTISHMKETDGFNDSDHVQKKVFKIINNIQKYRDLNQFGDIFENGLKDIENIEKYSEKFQKSFFKELGIENIEGSIFKSPGAVLQLDLDGNLVGADFESEDENGEKSLVSEEYEQGKLEFGAFKKALFHLLVSTIPDGPIKIDMVISYIKEVSKKQHFRGSYLSFNSVTGVSGSSISEEVVEKILQEYFNLGGSIDETIYFLNSYDINLKKSDLLAGIGDEMFARLISCNSKKKAKGHGKKIAKAIKKAAEKGELLNLC